MWYIGAATFIMLEYQLSKLRGRGINDYTPIATETAFQVDVVRTKFCLVKAIMGIVIPTELVCQQIVHL